MMKKKTIPSILSSHHTGDTFKGFWKNDTMHGRGTMTYANKNTCVDQWKRGEIEKGEMVFANGDVCRRIQSQ
jgi:hypothetical protein